MIEVVVLALAALIGLLVNALPDDVDDCPHRRTTDRPDPANPADAKD